jgi:hypothetical protein
MTPYPVLQVREWSTTMPSTPSGGALLRDVRLSAADRKLIAELEGRASLRFTELRSGLSVSVGPHIGTVNLSSIRLVILPKLRLDNLMRMVAYAFDLSDLLVTETCTTYESAEHGLMDLLGVSLLRSRRAHRPGWAAADVPVAQRGPRHAARPPRPAPHRNAPASGDPALHLRRLDCRPRAEPGLGRRPAPCSVGDGLARSPTRSRPLCGPLLRRPRTAPAQHGLARSDALRPRSSVEPLPNRADAHRAHPPRCAPRRARRGRARCRSRASRST